MKFENVKFYDENTKSITLITKVTDEEKREVEVKKHPYPFFSKGGYLQKAIDLGAELEENNQIVNSDIFEKLSNFIVELYNNKFSEEELIDGIDSGVIVQVYISILMGVIAGDSKNE